jgi:hypothetical protein
MAINPVGYGISIYLLTTQFFMELNIEQSNVDVPHHIHKKYVNSGIPKQNKLGQME